MGRRVKTPRLATLGHRSQRWGRTNKEADEGAASERRTECRRWGREERGQTSLGGRRADHWNHQEGTGGLLESVLAWCGESQHMGYGCMGQEDLEKYIHTAGKRVL